MKHYQSVSGQDVVLNTDEEAFIGFKDKYGNTLFHKARVIEDFHGTKLKGEIAGVSDDKLYIIYDGNPGVSCWISFRPENVELIRRIK